MNALSLCFNEEMRPSFATLQSHPCLLAFKAKKIEESEIPPSISTKIKNCTKIERLEVAPSASTKIKIKKKSGVNLHRHEQDLIARTEEVKKCEERLQDKIQYFEAQLNRAEKVLEKMENFKSLSLAERRTQSLERPTKEKRQVHFMTDACDNKENLPQNKINSLATDFEKRKTELHKRLKNAQDHALKLRSQEINSRFSTCVSFV